MQWLEDARDETGVVGRYGPVGVAVLHGSLDARFFERLGAALDALEEGGLERSSALVVRASKVPGSMPPALRDKAKTILSKHKHRLIGFAYVLGGRGLKATMVRTAMNAVLLTMPFDAKIFSDVPSATRWLAALDGQDPALRAAEADLLRTVQGLM